MKNMSGFYCLQGRTLKLMGVSGGSYTRPHCVRLGGTCRTFGRLCATPLNDAHPGGGIGCHPRATVVSRLTCELFSTYAITIDTMYLLARRW